MTPLEQQQRAHAVAQRLGELAHRAGLLPMPIVDAVAIDVVDALRAELARRGAQALAGEGAPGGMARRLAHLVRRELGAVRAGAGSTTRDLPPAEVLFLPRHRIHDLVPVAIAVAAQGAAPLMLRTIGDRAEWPSSLPTALVDALATPIAGTRALGFGARLARLVPRAVRDVLGASHHRLTAAFVDVLVTGVPGVTRIAEGMARLVRTRAPRVLVVGNHYTVDGRAAALTARALGLPVATFEHGSIFPGDPSWHDVPCDLVGVWGEASATLLVGEGLPRARVAVVGAPKLDSRLASFAPAQPRSSQVAMPQVLVATSGAGDKVSFREHAAFVDLLFAVAAAAPELSFFAKLHRKDKPTLYAAAAARFAAPPANLSWHGADESTFGVDIFAELARSRALLTIQSTAALDAMLAGVPVVIADIDGRGRAKDAPFLAHARVATDVASLVAALRSAVRGEAHPTDVTARAYVAQHYANLGQAAVAAASALLRLAGRPLVDSARST